MIKHVVMFKLKDEAEGFTKSENAKKIKELLDSLPAKISEIRGYEVGINIKDSERAYDICIYSTFDSMESLKSYIEHPEHQKAVEFILPRRSESKSCDYEV